MKKYLLLFVLFMLSIVVNAYDFEVGGIYYNIISPTNLTVSVTNSGINKDSWGNISGREYSGNLTIPDKVVYSGKTLTVVDISLYAFNESNIETIVLPHTLKTISGNAFESSNSLKEITIPTSVVSIGAFAFGNCSSLKKVVFEDTDSPLGIVVTNSYAGIFRLCPLENLYIGRSIERITSIGGNSWYDNSLSPFGFQELESNNLTITIGSKVKYLCDCLFKNAKSLFSINIPENIESIGQSVFEGCSQLKEVNIPSKLTEIPRNTFLGCESLETIILPDSVKAIYPYAFMDCSSLKNISLGNNISLIGNSAFKSCSSLESITLPQTLEKIDEFAFDQCGSLTSIISLPYTPPYAVDNSFSTIAYWNATLLIPYGTKSLYKTFSGWKNFDNIVEDMTNVAKYHLYYLVDGGEYKSYEIEYGTNIIPEPAPTKEGYTFSGWSEIPATMPAHDVTVTGSFSINKYKLTYVVDGAVYQSYELNYGTSITPEPTPTKEGYTFSGWSVIPATMPAHDVTVTGSFSINKYKLTYLVDGVVYQSYELNYGTSITPEPSLTKVGYTFSGWSEIPETMPAHDVTVVGTFSINKYKLTYMVDGEEYKSYETEYGAMIIPEAYPTKEGYTFSGWSEIPGTMPANDVTITGSFTINQYQVTYIVDGAIFKTEYVNYASKITPPSVPEKEGYSFAWNEYPETMPANDIIIIGQYSINSYKLSYIVDGAEYKSYDIVYNAVITPETDPIKEGYTFSGWSEIPETMPAHDVIVSGSFDINIYKLTYIMDNKVYKETKYEYGATIIPEPQPEGDYASFEWINQPQTMPAHDVVVYAVYTSGISDVLMANQRNIRIYSPNGKKLNKLQKGLNIVILDDGTVKRVVVK